MHILQIVIKNTSTLDFTLPVLRQVRQQNPDARISILYCVFDKRQILRESAFYGEVLTSVGAGQYDFAHFLRPAYRPFSSVLRWLFSVATADVMPPEGGREASPRRGSIGRVGRFAARLRRRFGVLVAVFNTVRHGLIKVEAWIGPRIVDVGGIPPHLNADLVLFDNRAATNFQGRDAFFAYFAEVKRPVVLLPHAPHFRDPVSEFCPFDENGHPLPDFCDFWSPLRFGTPWVQLPDRKKQFAVVGYPGLDSEWLTHVKATAAKDGRADAPGRRRKCLFIIRRYVPSDEERPADLDPFVIDFEEFWKPLTTLCRALRGMAGEVELVIKPHPANNYRMLARDLKRANVGRWSISHEPIYELLGEVDVVVSLFSTILLVPVMAGVPTIIVNSKLQQHVHAGWDLLEPMYQGLQLYAADVEELPKLLADVLEEQPSEDHHSPSADINHLRYFFPDGATQRCLDRISWLVKNTAK